MSGLFPDWKRISPFLKIHEKQKNKQKFHFQFLLQKTILLRPAMNTHAGLMVNSSINFLHLFTLIRHYKIFCDQITDSLALDILYINFFPTYVMIRFINFLLSSNICLDYKIILMACNTQENYNHLLCHGDGFHFNGPHLIVILLSSLSVFLPLDLAFTASQIII